MVAVASAAGPSVSASGAVLGCEPQRERHPAEDRGGEVDRAGDHEQRDAASGDVGGGHATALQRPRAERQATGAAGRQQDVGGLLGDGDLSAQPPGQMGTEHAAEGGDESQDRAVSSTSAATSHADRAPAKRSRTSPSPGSTETAATITSATSAIWMTRRTRWRASSPGAIAAEGPLSLPCAGASSAAALTVARGCR